MPAGDTASVICGCYRYIHDVVRREIAELDDDVLNWTPGPNTNSIATLVTHLIGSEIEALTVARGLQSGRDRPSEFEIGNQSSQSLLDQLGLADRALETNARKLTEEDLAFRRTGSPIPDHPPDLATGLDLLIWNVAHAREHLGQLLLTKQLFMQDRERKVGGPANLNEVTGEEPYQVPARADSLDANPWDEFASEFATFVERREEQGLDRDPILLAMLPLLGELRGKQVLDACCGEGFLSRVLASRGALVTGIDLSPRLIEIARQKDSKNAIDYRVADLSQRRPELEGKFDHIASHLALNDVRDYRGFAATLAALVKPTGRVVLAFNNPYSLVVRGHITDYFDSGARGLYGGLSQLGIQARSYHRTLEEYLDAFLGSGLHWIRLVDVLQERLAREWLLPSECRFPLFMILAFEKPVEKLLAHTD